MSMLKIILFLLVILCAYGVVGRTDYDVAVMRQNINKERGKSNCVGRPPVGPVSVGGVPMIDSAGRSISVY